MLQIKSWKAVSTWKCINRYCQYSFKKLPINQVFFFVLLFWLSIYSTIGHLNDQLNKVLDLVEGCSYCATHYIASTDYSATSEEPSTAVLPPTTFDDLHPSAFFTVTQTHISGQQARACTIQFAHNHRVVVDFHNCLGPKQFTISAHVSLTKQQQMSQ